MAPRISHSRSAVKNKACLTWPFVNTMVSNLAVEAASGLWLVATRSGDEGNGCSNCQQLMEQSPGEIWPWSKHGATQQNMAKNRVLPWSTMDYHGWPWTTMVDHELPWSTMDNHVSAWFKCFVDGTMVFDHGSSQFTIIVNSVPW